MKAPKEERGEQVEIQFMTDMHKLKQGIYFSLKELIGSKDNNRFLNLFSIVSDILLRNHAKMLRNFQVTENKTYMRRLKYFTQQINSAKQLVATQYEQDEDQDINCQHLSDLYKLRNFPLLNA